MSKFTVECPGCGCINEKKWFKDSVINCVNCGTVIDFKKLRMVARVCPKCHNTFVIDQKKDVNKCPVCKKELKTKRAYSENVLTREQNVSRQTVSVVCPQCSCGVDIHRSTESGYDECPVCGYSINIDLIQKKAGLVSDTGISVIQYEGDNSTFVWKHPVENFNLGSQLVVHESQEAVFFLNGEALDTFGPGRHTLETENLPVFKKIYSLPTEDSTPFHAEVYFINKTVQMGIKWGTDSRVRYIDPQNGVPLDIGASGEMNVYVSDSRKLLIKLIGTMNGISWESSDRGFAKSLKDAFHPMISTCVKSNLAKMIAEQNIDVFEIDSHLTELSKSLMTEVNPGFEDYGISVAQFYITNVSLPEDENFKRIRELRSLSLHKSVIEAEKDIRTKQAIAEAEIEAVRRTQVIETELTQTEIAKQKAERKVLEAQAEAIAMKTKGISEAEIMRAKGYTEKDIINADVQKTYAENMGKISSGGTNDMSGKPGGIAGDPNNLINMMAQTKVASVFLDKMDKVINFSDNQSTTALPNNIWTCSYCGEQKNTMDFCMRCGAKRFEDNISWICTECGEKGNAGNFCMNCGAKKPQGNTAWICPNCGEKGNTGNFCMNCGAIKPQSKDKWTCPECGEQDNTKNFCGNCGSKKIAKEGK